MPLPRARPGDPSPAQPPEVIAAALEAFLAEHPSAVVVEQGKTLFDMRTAKYSLATEYNRCTLQLWSDDRNLVRRVTATAARKDLLRLTVQRFGQTRPSSLDLVAGQDRRSPSTRESARTAYLRTLERVMLRPGHPDWGDWTPEAFRTAMDLERSFGPAYARGSLVRGQKAWAVIAVNASESQAIVDGILTLGVLWLVHCRDHAAAGRLYQGVRLIVPKGAATVTAGRLAWMNADAAQWQLWEFDERTEELHPRDPADHGNLTTRLLQAPNLAAARERFASSAARVLALVPEPMRPLVEQRVRSAAELAFLLHGLEFARVRMGYAGQSFNRVDEITFGAGANETPLTEETTPALRDLLARLFERRFAPTAAARPDPRDPLFRMQPERWLESILRQDITLLDPHLDPTHVYAQVPAFAASDRGMLDLLAADDTGRLVVLELKAEDDLHLAVQGLDYWIRVRFHHLHSDPSAAQSGLGDLQRHGYFPGLRLSPAPPRLFLVAPALRIHPATEVVLRYLSPQVEWSLLALDERWRQHIKVVWRKRSSDPPALPARNPES